jgi:Rv0078B-related antitoxin
MHHNRYFTDTTPEAEALLIQLARQASPSRKLQMVVELNRTMHTLMRAGIRNRHPNASEAEIRRHMADLLLGPELAAKAYGPWPTPETASKAEKK